MKGIGLALTIFISGCAAASFPVAAPPPAPALDPAPPTPAAAAVVAPPVAAVVQAYQAAQRKELPAISAPGVSADYVTNVRNLEISAREAVRRLVHATGQRRSLALASARLAVRALSDALAKQAGGDAP